MIAYGELDKMLRPAGGGIFTVSSGKAEQILLQKELYQKETEEEILAAWRQDLATLKEKKIALLGIPSDSGAGYLRGANFGPHYLRKALIQAGLYGKNPHIGDLGDVFSIPQLLHDEMLSRGQIRRSRQALYGDAKNDLPVSPLSIAERVLENVFSIQPDVKPVILGGDHSVAWPAISALAKRYKKGEWGILHFDAHTDLLPERLGVKYCYGTWAHHANKLVGREQHLVQIGIRTSQYTKAYWEKEAGVKQIWSEEILARPTSSMIEEVLAHFKKSGVKCIYISNDIDATDPTFASATGTLEPKGLEPDFICALINAIGREFLIIGADLVEVAPSLSHSDPGEPQRTCNTGALYLKAYFDAILKK